MQSHSTLARLQQVITLSLGACAITWLFWFWPSSPALAILGFLAIAAGYCLFLAAEFILMRWGVEVDLQPPPTWSELVGAWSAETLTAPLVFCWRQPFFWRAVPDSLTNPEGVHGRRGAVFVHGFFCNRGFWTPWLRRMQADGRCFVAVNLEPAFGSIDTYAPIIEQAVRDVTDATGLPPVLVCHSMGGVAARAWLRSTASPAAAHHVVTIGSPHRGTWLARFSHLANGRQMRQGCDWLAGLDSHEKANGAPGFTCWYAGCDNIVFPVATATLPGADNRLVRGAAHVDLAFKPEVMNATLALIAASDLNAGATRAG